jgi:hypothetical protein
MLFLHFCINNFPMLPASTTSRCYPYLHQQTSHHPPHLLPLSVSVFSFSFVREFESSRVQNLSLHTVRPPTLEHQPARCYPHLHQQSSHYFSYLYLSTAVLFLSYGILTWLPSRVMGKRIWWRTLHHRRSTQSSSARTRPLALHKSRHWVACDFVCDTAISQYPPPTTTTFTRNYKFRSYFLSGDHPANTIQASFACTFPLADFRDS